MKTKVKELKEYIGKFKIVTPEVLDDKVDELIKWYKLEKVKVNYTDSALYYEPKSLRDTIEKMAVWYEFRYPNEKVYKLLSGDLEDESIYEYQNVINDDEFTYEKFLECLSGDEEKFLVNKYYRGLSYLTNKRGAHIHADKNGLVTGIEGVRFYGADEALVEKLLRGEKVNVVYDFLKEKGVKIDKDSEFYHDAKEFGEKEEFINKVLDAVMYRIIERGGDRIGPRRALLFAKEFNRDIDIPMKYGIDTSDPDLRAFINEYLKAGGSVDLMCYGWYFPRKHKYSKTTLEPLSNFMYKISKEETYRYTEEERVLHERLVNVLSRKK